ncbi:MAG: FadR family transcriptional regulator [Acidobacteria bacterium]|nr:FadR family transcriptional regulator [Acidobacteriota bacterium]MBI3279689.1 FadR family transcriptional regulator [Acidobacteriota bacterium]
MLRTVAREQTLTQRAQQQLEELIVSGKLRPGDRLPSESEMGKMLGVSRTVVREAVRLLSAKGLVDARTGSGIYVLELNSSMIRDPMDLLLRSRAITVEDIVEVRALIEVHLAGLAAQRATSEDIAAMEDAILQLHNPGLSPREYAEIDVVFHGRLALAAGNPLFTVLAQSVNAVMVDPICFVYTRDKRARDETIREHSSVLNRVKARDPEGARKAMAASLVDARHNWGGYPAREPTLIPDLGRTAAISAERVRNRKQSSGNRRKTAVSP